jgi:acyl-CoA synthetase (AMP-forming)/AMP-acid ligase II
MADAFGERITSAAARKASRTARCAPPRGGAGDRPDEFSHAVLLDTNTAGARAVRLGRRRATCHSTTVSPVPSLTAVTARNARLAGVAPTFLERLTLPAGVHCADGPRLRRRRAGGCDATSDPAAVAVQLFTSGTTGAPKAAVLRHENLMSYILGTVEFAAAAPEEAALVAVPPYHIAGISAVLSSTYSGRRMVMLPSFDPAEWLRLVAAERITHAFVVPTMLVRIIETSCIAARHAALPPARHRAGGGGCAGGHRGALEVFAGVDFTNASRSHRDQRHGVPR